MKKHDIYTCDWSVRLVTVERWNLQSHSDGINCPHDMHAVSGRLRSVGQNTQNGRGSGWVFGTERVAVTLERFHVVTQRSGTYGKPEGKRTFQRGEGVNWLGHNVLLAGLEPLHTLSLLALFFKLVAAFLHLLLFLISLQDSRGSNTELHSTATD